MLHVNALSVGLSPRLRGNPTGTQIRWDDYGSIPAPAGEPVLGSEARSQTPVYPRACGGTGDLWRRSQLAEGLSPRLRGNHRIPASTHPGQRSIPAPAGEPRLPALCDYSWGVYPRACGGTPPRHRGSRRLPGLSPRLRGNPLHRERRADRRRSIPAPAGEPLPGPGVQGHVQVYPRACGGTTLLNMGGEFRTGLSPRLRGNLLTPSLKAKYLGSIPAPAGEPAGPPSALTGCWVYPRACGGTTCAACSRKSWKGLSPRLRGNLLNAHHARQVRRSIPAPAGEPGVLCRFGVIGKVYPRACGGTRGRPTLVPDGEGLSPRLRGNPVGVPGDCLVRRSIPAPAGEPMASANRCSGTMVYPRACGGTVLPLDGLECPGGLSPRLRGNLLGLVLSSHSTGSIPAPAGEPVELPRRVHHRGVYPRACGGTSGAVHFGNATGGLSPRLRGNHQGQPVQDGQPGSIPAPAGEPPSWTRMR